MHLTASLRETSPRTDGFDSQDISVCNRFGIVTYANSEYGTLSLDTLDGFEFGVAEGLVTEVPITIAYSPTKK